MEDLIEKLKEIREDIDFEHDERVFLIFVFSEEPGTFSERHGLAVPEFR